MLKKTKSEKKYISKISTADKSSISIICTTFIIISTIFITFFILNSKNKLSNYKEKNENFDKKNIVNKDIEENKIKNSNLLFDLFSNGDKSIENKNKINEILLKEYDVNATNNEGKTLLMYAAFYGDKSIVAKIIKDGANINAIDLEGRSALHWAADFGEQGTSEELIKSNIDKYAKDNFGNTPYDIAEFQEHTELLEILK